MVRVSRQHFGVGMALVAWVLLAVHLCSDPSDAHNLDAHDLGAVDSGDTHTHRQADANPSEQPPDVDCHSVAWVNHDRATFGSPANAHSVGPFMTARTVVQRPGDVSEVLEATPRAPDSSSPPLYLLHAALLI